MTICLAGCGGSAGLSGLKTSSDTVSTEAFSSLTTNELGAVETGLIASRILAANSAPSLSASVLGREETGNIASMPEPPDGLEPPDMPEFRSRGHDFHGFRSGNDWMLRPEDGGCEIEWHEPENGTPSMRIGSHTFRVERTQDTGIIITRPDNSTVAITPATLDSSTGKIDVDGVEWKFTWGENPLLTLENMENGRILTVIQDASGQLIITPAGGTPHFATWDSTGELAGENVSTGAKFRFRDGKLI